jgi:hypothetical protein
MLGSRRDGQDNLAGELSHPIVLPRVPVAYIGLLSRFRNGGQFPESAKAQGGHLLFILSGPEPQRTLLEDKIIDDVSHYPGTATIVRGLPSSLSTIPSTGMIKVFNHLPAAELRQEIEKAEFVISRCGYSTVMDLVAVQKGVLIPPGRQAGISGCTFHRRHIAFTTEQKKFSLPRILEEVKGFNYKIQSSAAKGELKHAIQNLLSKLQRQPN